MEQLVFVYGTLRMHEKYHHFLDGATLVAEQAWTRGKLYDTGNGYPALTEDNHHFVYGELYRVCEGTLRELDQLEGYSGQGMDNLYEKKLDAVFTDKGTFEAEIYYVKPTSKLVKTPIELGDWKVYRNLNEAEEIDYFAYGSCMDLERITKAGKAHLFEDVVGAGSLKGYSLRFTVHIHDGGRADMVEEGGIVEGKVYKLGREAVDYLYIREGVYTGMYRPALVDIDLGGVLAKNALTFLVCDKKKEVAPPKHYINEIYRGGQGILSEEYVNALEEHVARLKEE